MAQVGAFQVLSPDAIAWNRTLTALNKYTTKLKAGCKQPV